MTTRKLADAFSFCPQCGTPTKPGQHPFQCADAKCDFTLFFGPVAAVAGIVTDSDGKVLFLKRAKDPGKGKLGLPGGFVDAGETVEAALAREVFEETALKATAISYIASFPNVYVYRGIALDVTDMFYRCDVESFETLSAQEGEVTGFHLVKPTPADLDNMAFESNRRALELFLEARS
ncbi:NUDIX domain-containing protein [bacterium]|nr:NUDIX domain-containing protein [bacterium]